MSNFNNMTRIGNDFDNSQQNIMDTHFANYSLSKYFSDNDEHVDFATSQQNVMINGSGSTNGKGINGSIIDYDSELLIKSEQQRPFMKLQLFQRPFATVPYIGRGSVDPLIESQLQQGEPIHGMKSVSTIMEKSFMDYSLYPVDSTMQEYVSNPSYTVEEAALDGWVRGGSSTRV